MTVKKHTLASLIEIANGALPSTFSTQVLSNTPNVQDDSNDDPDSLLCKKLKTMMNTVDEPSDNDTHLFSILKTYLTDDDYNELETVGPYEANNDTTDKPHAGEIADEKNKDEKHQQLLAAINDLRNELKAIKSNKPQPRWKVSRFNDHEENEESYEEDEQTNTKQERARQMFTALVNQGMSRQDIIDQFMKQIGVTDSTATSYYQRLAKEAGLTTSGDREMPGQSEPPGLGTNVGTNQNSNINVGQSINYNSDNTDQELTNNIDGFEVEGDPNRQGLIRTVKGAHLVYKRKNNEGTYDELWVFGTGNNDIRDSLEVRRAILAGTDIPPRALKSENGQQSYTLTTLGNGQLLHIKGQQN